MTTNKKIEKKNFDNVLVQGILTATSNKESEDYKQKTPTKTLYIHVPDEKQKQELIDFGLTLYTPDKENDPEALDFFVIKASANIKFYLNSEDTEEIDFSTKSPNVYTDELVMFSVVYNKPEKGNEFYRVNGILAPTVEVLKEVEPVNPFASLFEK